MTLRGIFVCSTFPRPDQPNWGLVNGLHVRALSKWMELQVLSPQPYFPLARSGRPAIGTGLRDFAGIPVHDTRAFYIPLSRGSINGWLYGRSIRRELMRMCRSFGPHFLMTSFGFPDAVGVAQEAELLGIPLVAILRGSDVHTYCRMPSRWRSIIRALKYASLVVPISHSLAAEVIKGGVDESRVHVIHYGIDRETFCVRDRNQAAECLGLPLERKRVLFVGNLVAIKCIPALIEAFAALVHAGDGTADLYILGEGPERRRVESRLREYHLESRARLLGAKTNSEVAHWMSACDVLCLPSLNEGLPNVILEAFACGLPVVASRVGGIPDVHPGTACGALVDPGNSTLLGSALQECLNRVWSRKTIAEHVQAYTWENNARTMCELLQSRVLRPEPVS